MFLLPLGVPPIDTLDLNTNTYMRTPRPNPPPRTFISSIIPKSPDISYYELLLNKLEFNNNDFVQKLLSKSSNPPSPPNRTRLEPIFESQESDELL